VKNLNKIGIFSSILCLSIAIGALWERKSDNPIQEISADCGCYCHKLHEKEEKEMLAQIGEDRALILEEKRKASEILMAKQYEECSKPFRDFIEKLNTHENQ